MSVTHVAGPMVKIGDRVIQRCTICGEKLIDSLHQATADGEHQWATWCERALIRIDGSHESVVGDFIECEQLPEDFCLPLVEL